MPSLTRIANTSIALGALCGVSQGASEPPNGPAEIQIAKAERSIEIRYDGQRVFEGRYSLDSHLDLLDKVDLRVTSETGARGEVTQHIALSAPSGTQVILEGVLACSTQAFPAETASPAQERFKLVRNSVGLSSNLRNNAVYDRKRDWMLEGKGETQIKPVGPGKASREFKWISKGAEVNLTFRPRYYQKHKNLPYFRPWEYDVWKGSVTGWCSW